MLGQADDVQAVNVHNAARLWLPDIEPSATQRTRMNFPRRW